jgi:hypothetical protein
MAKIVNLNERKFAAQLRPLARILFRLVGACRRLIQQRPDDPELDEIKGRSRSSSRSWNMERTRTDYQRGRTRGDEGKC